MTPQLRRLALVSHITVTVGWIGSALAYLALVVSGMVSPEPQTLRAAWITMGVIGWIVMVPLAVASVLTGLVMSVGTAWGLVRHYWVLASFVLTVVATAALLQHMQTVSFFANVAAQPDSTAAVAELRGGLGLVVLLLIEVLNVYKPPGMTVFGRRTSQIASTAQPLDADPSGQRTRSAHGNPFWVRVVGAHAIGLVVLLAIMHLTGSGLRFH
jgi:hypothetical protein